MRIAIFTIFDAYNYGSFLQAFAMQTFLESRGHEVYMVDVRDSLKSVIAQKYFAKSWSRTALKLKRWHAYHKDWKLLNIFPYDKCPDVDMAIIGSDEVWNIENESFTHAPQFYGIGTRARCNIGYAPSLGYSTDDSYDGFPQFKDSIARNFSWIGTRDYFTREFVKNLGQTNTNMVCDPTLLIADKWKEYEKTCRINDPFMIYYSYMDNTPFKEYILRFARVHGLRVLSVGFDYKWCDSQRIVSPTQFLYLMRRAEYVVTSTFHGTVFSSLYKKRFIQVHPARKAVDYLTQLGIDRQVQLEKGYDFFEKKLAEELDYDSISQAIEQWSTDSRSLIIKNCRI